MENKKQNTSVFQLFKLADGVDQWLVLMGIIGSIGDGLMNPLTMWVLSRTLNTYGTAASFLSSHIVDEYAVQLVYVALGVGIAAFIEGLCWTRTAERQTSRMRMEYLKNVLRQDVAFFDTNGTNTTSEVVTTISVDAHIIQDVLSEKIPNMIAGASTFIFSLVVAFLMSWKLTLAVLPFSLLYIVPGVTCGKLMMEVARKMKETYGVAGATAEQAVSSIRTVVSCVAEHQTLERFKHALEPSMALGIKQGFLKGMAIGSVGMVYAVWSFQAWIGCILVTETRAQPGHVFIAGLCVLLGGLSIMGALPNLRYISEATAAASRIFEMINQLPTIDSDDKTGLILEHVRGEIEFKNVDFAYPSRPDSPILQGFDLKVMAGMTIGLVGGSGSGKSTVISLLERFYDPVRGDILFDGKNITRLQLKWLRSQMGLVSQEPILFATSIKENILFGNDTASMELVVAAAKVANAHDFITKLPEGYDTQVGQFGVQMSGGQKQRISIARALLKDPRILLLDEATSALDTQSERAVQDALDQAAVGRTTIIIAHRLSTLCNADLIAVVQSGKVVESGSHDQLIQMSNGAYSAMVRSQQSTMKNEEEFNAYSLAEIESNHHKMVNKKNSSNIGLSIRSPAPSIVRAGTPELSFIQGSSPALSAIQDHLSSSPNKETSLKSSARSSPSQWRMLKMNSQEWKRAMFGCFGAIAFGAVQPLHSYCLGSVLGVFFLNDKELIKSKIKVYCFIFLTLAFVSIVTNLIQHYNFAVMGERLTKRIREKMLERVLTFEIGWFDRDENSSAAICARLAAEANVVRSLVGDRLSLLLQVTTTASLAFVLGLVVAWRVAIVMIAIQPLLIGCFYSRRVLMINMSTKARKAQNEGSQLASEAVVNHRTITAFSSQKRVLGLYESCQKGPQRENMKQSWFAGLGLFISQFVTTASIALTFWYGGRLMIQGLVIPKHLFQAFFILMTTGKVIADAGSMTSDLAKGSSAVKSVFEILDRRSEIEPDDSKGINTRKIIKGHIELKNVFFFYPLRPGQMIFRGLSLKIEAGKTVALVGQSGSGKSTIIGLIERFYDTLKGSVEIDGQDIKSYNLRHLRSHIALVSQEPTLFAGTISENITYGNENATETEIIEAAKLANAHEFVRIAAP
ncbi:ABC transporter B family member 15-like isoform X2 [Magnolia sinica]|uniref:ABC transporter B family member 15-like isoform X2 n=1 Tax=Magnolia sinica TaxID=86752 RepID=UPI002659B4DE|nr:ABC transporter B family member 15-like isoform X2 [Magnolia sinica]